MQGLATARNTGRVGGKDSQYFFTLVPLARSGNPSRSLTIFSKLTDRGSGELFIADA